MERRFDLVVIGTGIASAVASRCREAGWTVAVVDYRPFGGTCALRGCIPKKILVSAAEAVHGARTMADRGVRPGEVSIDWPDLIRVKRSVTDPVPAQTEEGWAQAGVVLFHGRARFVGPTTVEVGADRLIGRHVLIATGAMPMPLPFPGREHVATSEQFMELAELPRRIVFVGGGYISFEFAHVAAQAGAQITILHRARAPSRPSIQTWSTCWSSARASSVWPWSCRRRCAGWSATVGGARCGPRVRAGSSVSRPTWSCTARAASRSWTISTSRRPA